MFVFVSVRLLWGRGSSEVGEVDTGRWLRGGGTGPDAERWRHGVRITEVS